MAEPVEMTQEPAAAPATTDEKPKKEKRSHSEDSGDAKKSSRLAFGLVAGGWQIVMLILFCTVSEYHEEAKPETPDGKTHGLHVYTYFSDVHAMIFVGFGFLMTFLKKYGYGAVGFNFVLSALCLQWAVLVNTFWNNVQDRTRWHRVEAEIPGLVEGDFAAASVMITYGAVIGKLSSIQLLLVAILEIPFYALNKMIIERLYGCVDIGGSMVIHEFGAFFGLALAWVLRDKKQRGHKDNGATPTSDLFAMIGTIFLWIFWPSFNGALGWTSSIQSRAVINTVFSLAAACVTAFAASAIFRKGHKLSMVDIQNATLAGGVCVGTSASMALFPGGAIGIGMIAGLVSVLGYVYVQPFMERTIGLNDVCGVQNLHGMPGFLGGFISIIVAGAAKESIYGAQFETNFPRAHSAQWQAGVQAASVFTTLFLSLFFGALVGLLMLLLRKTVPENIFDDDAFWIVESEESEHKEKADV